jgi:hypothetical protein
MRLISADRDDVRGAQLLLDPCAEALDTLHLHSDSPHSVLKEDGTGPESTEREIDDHGTAPVPRPLCFDQGSSCALNILYPRFFPFFSSCVSRSVVVDLLKHLFERGVCETLTSRECILDSTPTFDNNIPAPIRRFCCSPTYTTMIFPPKKPPSTNLPHNDPRIGAREVSVGVLCISITAR